MPEALIDIKGQSRTGTIICRVEKGLRRIILDDGAKDILIDCVIYVQDVVLRVPFLIVLG